MAKRSVWSPKDIVKARGPSKNEVPPSDQSLIGELSPATEPQPSVVEEPAVDTLAVVSSPPVEDPPAVETVPEQQAVPEPIVAVAQVPAPVVSAVPVMTELPPSEDVPEAIRRQLVDDLAAVGMHEPFSIAKGRRFQFVLFRQFPPGVIWPAVFMACRSRGFIADLVNGAAWFSDRPDVDLAA